MNNEMMRVSHPELGKGYIFVIAEDYFTVKFRFHGQKEFPISAFEDGSLIADEETVNRFKEHHQRLMERKKAKEA